MSGYLHAPAIIRHKISALGFMVVVGRSNFQLAKETARRTYTLQFTRLLGLEWSKSDGNCPMHEFITVC
jgi:hypothetical protein